MPAFRAKFLELYHGRYLRPAKDGLVGAIEHLLPVAARLPALYNLAVGSPPGSELGTRGFDSPDAGDTMCLFNLAPVIDATRRFSRVHQGRGELLDQILASEEFFPRGPDGRRRRPVEVDSHVGFAGGLPSVGAKPAAHAT